MSQPSQDLAKIRQQVKAEQEKLHNLTQATQAAQSAWDDQRKQIKSDTEVTIAASKQAILEATKEGKAELKQIKVDIEVAQKAFKTTLTANDEILSESKKTIEKAEFDKKVLQEANNKLRSENRDLESANSVLKDEVINNTELKHQLINDISQLRTDLTGLESEKALVENSIADKNDQLEALDDKLEADTEEYERKIAILEAKKSDLEREIISNKENDKAVRDNLSKWAKELDEKDKNLRIREAKVEEQEKSIVRNYNLLNL